MNSVERVSSYTSIPSEAPQFTHVNPPAGWPFECAIDIHNLALRYRAGLDLVLKGINCHIKGKEKIGIVGRTGAGKSSLVSCFFRLVEPVSGSKIIIDGVDIMEIGLSPLRSNLCIIPQDPMLFQGTIRWNLDPEGEYTDHEIWDSLAKCYIKDYVTTLPLGLETAIVESMSWLLKVLTSKMVTTLVLVKSNFCV